MLSSHSAALPVWCLPFQLNAIPLRTNINPKDVNLIAVTVISIIEFSCYGYIYNLLIDVGSVNHAC